MCVKKKKKYHHRALFQDTGFYPCQKNNADPVCSQFHSSYGQLDLLLFPLPTKGLSGYLVSLQNLLVGYLIHESIFAWIEEGIW